MGRGGKRKGAGRPRKYAGGARRLRLVLSDEAAKAAEENRRQEIAEIILGLLAREFPALPWSCADEKK